MEAYAADVEEPFQRITATTGARIGKRQVEEEARRARYLVRDRMDKTGARWSLAGAEAVLKLRALRANGDFDDYWRFHLDAEHRRNHAAHYADSEIPNPLPARPRLRRVR